MFVDIAIVLLIVLIILLLAKPFFLPATNTKAKYIKKQEIVDDYEKRLNMLKTKKQKLKLLKQINQELARNIFFDKNELKETMKILSEYIVK